MKRRSFLAILAFCIALPASAEADAGPITAVTGPDPHDIMVGDFTVKSPPKAKPKPKPKAKHKLKQKHR